MTPLFDCRAMTEDLRMVRAWLAHWREDMDANLHPTPSSLDEADELCARVIDRLEEAVQTTERAA